MIVKTIQVFNFVLKCMHKKEQIYNNKLLNFYFPKIKISTSSIPTIYDITKINKKKGKKK